jgi:hypothetical protein
MAPPPPAVPVPGRATRPWDDVPSHLADVALPSVHVSQRPHGYRGMRVWVPGHFVAQRCRRRAQCAMCATKCPVERAPVTFRVVTPSLLFSGGWNPPRPHALDCTRCGGQSVRPSARPPSHSSRTWWAQPTVWPQRAAGALTASPRAQVRRRCGTPAAEQTGVAAARPCMPPHNEPHLHSHVRRQLHSR